MPKITQPLSAGCRVQAAAVWLQVQYKMTLEPRFVCHPSLSLAIKVGLLFVREPETVKSCPTLRTQDLYLCGSNLLICKMRTRNLKG